MAAKDFFKIAYSSTIKYFSCNCHCTLNYICLLLLSWKNWDIWDEGAYIVTVSVLMSDTFYVDEWQFLCRRVTISVLKWVKVSVLMSDCFFVEDWQFLCQWVIVSVSLSDCFCIIEWQFLCWWVTVSLSLSDSFCVYAWHCSFFFCLLQSVTYTVKREMAEMGKLTRGMVLGERWKKSRLVNNVLVRL